MAINQIESAPQVATVRSPVRLNSGDRQKEDKFVELLATSETSTSVNSVAPADAETAAEILRLQMLRSAVSLGGSDDGYSSMPTADSISRALSTYLEQQRQHPTASHEAPNAISIAPEEHPATTLPVAQNSSLETIIVRASRRYGVEVGLIKAVIKAESNFNAHAVSHAGAQGLMQLMPSTAKGLGVTDSFDAEQNVMAGTRFLKDMLNRYGGNVDSALAAYNWGPGNVDRHAESLPRETRDYLVKVKRYYRDYSV